MVSIIMPCYNGGRYLNSSIGSVISQSYENWELIIVDDCSTDNSVEIIKQFQEKDQRIKLFSTSFPSGGPAVPRNIGLSRASGEYIAFLDADDIWLPEKLSHQMLLFHDNVSIVYANYEKIDANGERKNRVVIAPEKVSYHDLLFGNCIACSTAVIKNSFESNELFNQIGHEDYEYWLSLLSKGGMAVNSGSVEMLYRVSPKSVSSNKFKTVRWTWNIFHNYRNLSIIQSCFYLCSLEIRALFKYLK